MRKQEQTKLAAMMATLFLAAAEALAQDQQSPASDEGEESRRRIIIKHLFDISPENFYL